MAASAVQNPVSTESKSAKKKKAKATSAATQAVTTPSREESSTPIPEGTQDSGAYESPYIKELYKLVFNSDCTAYD